ncbi:MAG: HNH endonuclease signature motif containing protein, partial [Deltaproteobacteria bacterium]
IEFCADEGMAEKIERAKEILRHKFREGKFEDIFNQALEDLLEKRDPMRKIERAKKREVSQAPGETKRKENTPEKSEKFLSRYISQETRRKVWERDGGRCSYENAEGRRCGERNFIQIDHVQPFALWGESTEENLRLLCAQHNRWRAERTFDDR